jgi:hypothetical protein
MPHQTKSRELSACEERERLLREIRDAIRQNIRMRDVPDGDAALKAWKKVRKALMHHMEKHDC